MVFYGGLRFLEAHLYVFYVAGRLSGCRMSNQAVTPGGSAKERPSRAWGEGEEGGSLDLAGRTRDRGTWMLLCMCFTSRGGPRGFASLTKPGHLGGPLKKAPTPS